MKIPFTAYEFGLRRQNRKLEAEYERCRLASESMQRRSHARFHIINALLERTGQKRYLEIGVRNPADNFDKIEAKQKFSVDPGLEVSSNSATFRMTSDEFFTRVRSNDLRLEVDAFDVIFIDGLHLAEQVFRDINNALTMLADVGYLVIHDCNPPTNHHARERFDEEGPARHFWNGTTWKAFQRFRTESTKRCFVVDVDWGVGVVVNHEQNEAYRLSPEINPFYEYECFDKQRKEILNLLSPSQVEELNPPD